MSNPDRRSAEALNQATRRVIDLVRRSKADPEAMRVATAALEAVAEQLEPDAVDGPFAQRDLVFGGIDAPGEANYESPTDFAEFFPYSPLVGPLNPLAPPMEFTVKEGRVHGKVTYGAPYVGPPQHVHGGIIAATFDELLGSTNLVHMVGGMTGTLTIKYRRPTPVLKEIELEGWLDRVDGRKVYAHGEMRHAGEVTAEAEGIFITGSMEQLRRSLNAA
jgi:acyl-coenzyme A thioesterase PaaI-like protein